jgi:hypothetical protein
MSFEPVLRKNLNLELPDSAKMTQEEIQEFECFSSKHPFVVISNLENFPMPNSKAEASMISADA